MVKENQVARGMRIKLNSNFEINSLSDKYLACEPILYIDESFVYSDTIGKYVFIKGGSHTNSGIAYLNEIDLEFPITEYPLYPIDNINYNQDLSRFKNNLL